jgi:hypothetical protein
MNLSRLSRYEVDIRNLDEFHKTGKKGPKFSFGISTSVSRAVTRPSELWTHSLFQEHFLGQKAAFRRSQESIASFGLREGVPIGSIVQLHGTKGWVLLEFWLYVLAPQVLTTRSSSLWHLSTFSECPFSPLQLFPIHPLQGASLYLYRKPNDDIY